jgi:hypothetical protein
LQKGLILCQGATVQDPQARGLAQVGVWVGSRVKVEAEWAGHFPQVRAVIAYVRTAAQQLLMLQGSLVMQKAVLNVVQK